MCLVDNMTKSLEIKICGIVDQFSMSAVLDAEVEYIGLVYYKKSPRYVSIEFSKKLLENRNSHSKIVALTVDPDDHIISQIIRNIQPDFIQLHGNETPERCMEIKEKFNISIIKGIGIKTRHDLIQATERFEEFVDLLLLDAPSMTLPGGNGSKFNWDILNNYHCKKKMDACGRIKFQ